MGSPLLPPAPMARASVCIAYRWRVGVARPMLFSGCTGGESDAFSWMLVYGERNVLGSAPSLEVANEEIAAVAKLRGFPEPLIVPHAPPEALGQPSPKEVASA